MTFKTAHIIYTEEVFENGDKSISVEEVLFDEDPKAWIFKNQPLYTNILKISSCLYSNLEEE